MNRDISRHLKIAAVLITIAVSMTALFLGQELKAILVLVFGIYMRLMSKDN